MPQQWKTDNGLIGHGDLIALLCARQYRGEIPGQRYLATIIKV